jgi:hypothetical protein
MHEKDQHKIKILEKLVKINRASTSSNFVRASLVKYEKIHTLGRFSRIAQQCQPPQKFLLLPKKVLFFVKPTSANNERRF